MLSSESKSKTKYLHLLILPWLRCQCLRKNLTSKQAVIWAIGHICLLATVSGHSLLLQFLRKLYPDWEPNTNYISFSVQTKAMTKKRSFPLSEWAVSKFAPRAIHYTWHVHDSSPSSSVIKHNEVLHVIQFCITLYIRKGLK